MKRCFRKVLTNRYLNAAADALKACPVTVGVAAMAIMAAATDALAWTAPAAGSFAYDVYDIAVNQLLNGPIGFVTGMGIMAAGGYMVTNSRAGGMASGIPMIILGGALIKLDTIIQSLGFTV